MSSSRDDATKKRLMVFIAVALTVIGSRLESVLAAEQLVGVGKAAPLLTRSVISTSESRVEGREPATDWLRPTPALPLSVAILTPPPRKPGPPSQVRTAQIDEDQVRALNRLIAEMQRKLDERDTIIANLLGRVENLEQRADGETEQGGSLAEQRPSPPPAADVPPRSGRMTPQPPDQDVARSDQAPLPPGQFEVDEEMVDRALERALVETGALLLRPGAVEIEPAIGFTRREDDVPTIALQNGVPLEFTRNVRRNEITNSTDLRIGLPSDAQFELGIPFRYENVSSVFGGSETNTNAWGLGDVRIGLAKTLLRENGWRPDLIGRVRWDSDTGQEDDGIQLGSGFHEIGGSLTAVKRQDPLVFVGTVGYEAAFEEDDRKPGDEVNLSLGTVLAVSPETSLRFSLQQTFTGEAEVSGREVPGSDDVDAMLMIGASSVIAPRTLLDVAAGIGVGDDGSEYIVELSLPIRFDLRELGVLSAF